MAVEKFWQRHTPSKSWGWEEWIVNNGMYCGKRLHFEEVSGRTSLHFHVKKHETMYVESGVFNINVVDTTDGSTVTHYLSQGDSLVIPPNTPHRIIAMVSPSILVEFSTHHDDSDSYRVEL